MGKDGSARAILAGAAIIALAGCTGVGTATAPDVPGQAVGNTSTAATSPASSAAEGSATEGSATEGSATEGRGRESASSTTDTRQRQTSKSFVKADSLPFPVAVGNTWVYRTTVGDKTGQTTNRIVSAGPVPAGYEVTMSSTTDVAGTAIASQPVYLFYPDGTIGYPVPPINGVSVVGGGIRWPDAAGLASGRAYHSVLRILDSQTGQYENANVTVRGEGTTSVRVPAGTYQTSVVDTTITAKVGGYTTTVEVATWIAQGTGPVQTAVLIQVAGKTQLTTTNVLLSFTKAAVTGVGS
jgi:hypothetical protein